MRGYFWVVLVVGSVLWGMGCTPVVEDVRDGVNVTEVAATEVATTTEIAVATEDAMATVMSLLEPTDVPTVRSTRRPTATPQPTATLEMVEMAVATADVVGIGTPLPETEVLTVENIGKMVEIGRWGKGAVRDAAYSPDGAVLYVLTGQGVYLYEAATGRQIDLWVYAAPITALAVSPDGEMLALSFATEGNRMELRWTADNSLIRAFHGHGRNVGRQLYSSGLTFSADGTLLFSEGQKARVWRVADGELVFVQPHEYEGEVAFAAGSKQVMITNGEELFRFNVMDRNSEWETIALTGEMPEYWYLFTAEVSPDGSILAMSGSGTPWFTVWEVDSGQKLYQLDGMYDRTAVDKQRRGKPALVSGPGRDGVTDFAFSKDGRRLITANGFYMVRVWDMGDGSLIRSLPEVGREIILSPDEQTIGGIWHTLTQWDLESGSYVNELLQHIGGITDLIALPQRNQLAIASADGWVYLRNIENGSLVRSLHAGVLNDTSLSSPSVRDMDLSADGRMLATAANDSIRFWDLEAGTMVMAEERPRTDIGADSVVLVDSGRYAVSKEHDMPVLVWNTADGSLTDAFGQLGYSSLGLTASLVEPFLLFSNEAYFGEGLKLWTGTGVKRLSLETEKEIDFVDMRVAAFSPNGRYVVATTRQDNEIFLWGVDGLEAMWLYVSDTSEKSSTPQNLAFSADSNWVAAAYSDHVSVWNVADGTLLLDLPVDMTAYSVAFTPDGRYLAIGHGDGSVRLWGIPAE